MARLHGILLTVAHRSPMLSVGSDWRQQHSHWWWCHDTGSPRLAADHSLCTVPWSGTLCLTTSAHSRTMSLLNRAWKPGCFLDTSVHSALETFVTMRYINLHLPLPLPSNDWLPAWVNSLFITCIGIIRNNSLVGGCARITGKPRPLSASRCTATWRPSALTTWPHGQVWSGGCRPNKNWSELVDLNHQI